MDEERVHFRTLSKRTRDRILQSADEHNKGILQQAQKDLLVVVKKKNTRKRIIFIESTASMEQATSVFDEQLKFWQSQCEMLEQQKKSVNKHHRNTSKKKQVLSCLKSFFLCLSSHLLSCRVLPSVVLFCFAYLAFDC